MFQDIIDGVVGGLTDFIGSLGAGIIDLILSLITGIVNIVLFPINALITSFFPNFSSSVSTFSEGLTRLTTAPIGYFAYHIPPITRGVLLLYLTIMLGYYTIIWTYRGIILIPTVIRKIKFW